MYYHPYGYSYQNPSYMNDSMYNYGQTTDYWMNPDGAIQANQPNPNNTPTAQRTTGRIRDFGPNPVVVNISEATKRNNTFRTALWTGTHLQTTLMSLGPGEDIGLEIHPDVDQFIRIEQGQGLVQMGKSKNTLSFERTVYDDFAIIIPAGTWHNITNTGDIPLKLYSIYAPPNHPFGTIHRTKADAEAAERGRGYNNRNTGYDSRNYW
ncbi:cupin domain-containing protein [Sporosarcina sp. ACRSL]|uniref:cupin domain-containing protein n=1 Tax=Sporosarcina sp. ACRSL TaxID=2918215 RepID=UPI001EF4B164|nr:cupin domain-containing protein [Sporosarcina sp. ACRSL]MCG7342646.1 cupin domain-containing protein [Sporosarcina sp. ACRSL]